MHAWIWPRDFASLVVKVRLSLRGILALRHPPRLWNSCVDSLLDSPTLALCGFALLILPPIFSSFYKWVDSRRRLLDNWWNHIIHEILHRTVPDYLLCQRCCCRHLRRGSVLLHSWDCRSCFLAHFNICLLFCFGIWICLLCFSLCALSGACVLFVFLHVMPDLGDQGFVLGLYCCSSCSLSPSCCFLFRFGWCILLRLLLFGCLLTYLKALNFVRINSFSLCSWCFCLHRLLVKFQLKFWSVDQRGFNFLCFLNLLARSCPIWLTCPSREWLLKAYESAHMFYALYLILLLDFLAHFFEHSFRSYALSAFLLDIVVLFSFRSNGLCRRQVFLLLTIKTTVLFSILFLIRRSLMTVFAQFHEMHRVFNQLTQVLLFQRFF